MFTNVKKIFRFGAQSFARNFWLALLTISILVLLLLSINVLVVLNFLTDEAARQMKAKVDVSVYLKPEVSDLEAQNFRAYLLTLPSVASVTYTDPDTVLKNFKAAHVTDEKIISSLSVLGKNPFGGVLTVQTVNVNDYKAVLTQISGQVYQKIIENKDFNDHEDLVNAINRLTSYIKQLIIIVSAFFAFIALAIIFNTIKIAIYTHREEMAIMKLVGASNWFVRAPFIVEAIMYSLIATVVTFALIFPLISLVQFQSLQFFDYQGGDILGYYRNNFFVLFGLEFLSVMILSSFSATLAIGRYLKK